VTRLFGATFAVAVLIATAASAAGDPTADAVVFKSQCSACYAVDGHDCVGPRLDGVVGRKAGSVPGYSLSAANREFGLIWADNELMAYLDNPRKVIPGTKMPYAGLHDVQKRADLIAYLATLTKQTRT
jgi:cytochrome c